MLYLAFIFHMHQPYYKNLLTGETGLPWVRLHGVKDYLDMVKILEGFPAIHQTFNVVPSLFEQVEDYTTGSIKDTFLTLTLKEAATLTDEDKQFLLTNFFSINKDRVIATYPRYYELYFKKERKQEFSTQDFLDLQVLFNLAWIDPHFKEQIPELRSILYKGRFYSESDKHVLIEKQLSILHDIIPGYRAMIEKGQIEVTVTPYYHPILPLLYNTNTAKEANPKTLLPKNIFSYPEDAREQIDDAVSYYTSRFGSAPQGMWPSEESVSEHILPYIINAGIKWIVTDEAILFSSLKMKKRNTHLLYQPHCIKKKEGRLNIVFRDRNLSDLIGFTYHTWHTEDAVANFMHHLENIAKAFTKEDILVTIAMDGENAWEYYPNDGWDFLTLLYRRLSESKVVKTTTVTQYLKDHACIQPTIKRLAAGSWIYGRFDKWMGHPLKALAWDYLKIARDEYEKAKKVGLPAETLALAHKQIHILEGSDWFWWFGEDPTGDFDRLFRMHLANFYTIIGINPPEYTKHPLH